MKKGIGIMSEDQKAYAKYLKETIKEILDRIDTETEEDLRILKLIYQFTKAGFAESRIKPKTK